MLKTNVIAGTSAFDAGAQATVILLEQGQAIESVDAQNIDQSLKGIKLLLAQDKFEGKVGQLAAFPFVKDEQVNYIMVAGLGKVGKDGNRDIEKYRRTLGSIIKLCQKHKIASVALLAPNSSQYPGDLAYLIQQTVITARMASYAFDAYRTDVDRKVFKNIELRLVVAQESLEQAQKAVVYGVAVSDGVNAARHWIDLPPSALWPESFANEAREIAKSGGLKITVFDEKQAEEMGMGGLVGVSRGSDRDCQLVVMEYHYSDDAQTLAFVGKGITFDSGGLSLKPPSSMETMKEDMSGAAAVFASMQALATLKPEVNVICIAPLSENLPSGKATKPGDILKFYNGKTAEVLNTDAEGRLVLADALSYVIKQYKPDAVIDLATLTGACAYALGPFYSALLSQHESFSDSVKQAGSRSGDHVWALPLDDDYSQAIKSDVADIKNIGNRKILAGTITAAHFLKNFVGDTPWVHLDIAGTAFDVPGRSYYRNGATGAGVRLLVDLAMNWGKS